MARKALKVKALLKPKFKSRVVRRCLLCGRTHAVLRKFGMCRLCFRKRALNGELPGITKASW
jgi:small subunit ribosomal protein S14